jgi:hypothetical protein
VLARKKPSFGMAIAFVERRAERPYANGTDVRLDNAQRWKTWLLIPRRRA